jgi:hypothetical protein
LNRKKNEEIQLVITKKDRDIATYRKKLTILAKQLLQLKKEQSGVATR